MDLNNKRKKYVRIDRSTRSEEIFAQLDEVNSDQEEDIDNLMNDSDTEFIVYENLDNDIDSDDKPLSVLIPEANIHVVQVLQLRQIWKKVRLCVRRKASKEVRGRAKKKQPKRRVLTSNGKKRLIQSKTSHALWKLKLLLILHQNNTNLLIYFRL